MSIQNNLQATLRHSDTSDINFGKNVEEREFDYSFSPVCKLIEVLMIWKKFLKNYDF